MGDHALLGLGRGFALLEVGGQQIHVLLGVGAAGGLVEAHVNVIPGHGRDLLPEEPFHMPVPERAGHAKRRRHHKKSRKPKRPEPGVFCLLSPQEEDPQRRRDHQDQRDGPHQVDRREQQPERKREQQRGQRLFFDELFQAQKQQEKQQDQKGIDRLGKHERAEHQLAGRDGPQERRKERCPLTRKLFRKQPHKAAA